MYRNPKFRVWDKKARRFLSEEEMNDIGGFYYSYCLNPDPKDYELQQYIGIKDKNNQEIYSGDVVLCAAAKWEIKLILPHCFLLSINLVEDNGEPVRFMFPIISSEQMNSLVVVGNIKENNYV